MTISDEELYRLAEKARNKANDMSAVCSITINELKALRETRDSVLQRFKPREPRVFELWGVAHASGDEFFSYSRKKAEQEAKGEWYLAKAIITEVMEEE